MRSIPDGWGSGGMSLKIYQEHKVSLSNGGQDGLNCLHPEPRNGHIVVEW